VSLIACTGIKWIYEQGKTTQCAIKPVSGDCVGMEMEIQSADNPLSRLHIGTSGWSYGDWVGIIYPEKTKPTDYLKHYTQHFPCTEINNSFYNIPKRKFVEKWMGETPEHFLFCPKIYRGVTHFRKLKPGEDLMRDYWERWEGFDHRLGPFLIQLPPSLAFHAETVQEFYELLKRGPKLKYALEARHTSWFTDESLLLMHEYDISFAIGDAGKRFPYYETVTNNTVFLRMHGRKILYATLYTEKELQSFARKIAAWLKEGLEVWVFFNNTMFGFALENAKQLMRMIEGLMAGKTN
jgi:uncharacterized protein YecE (DUF72 family)